MGEREVVGAALLFGRCVTVPKIKRRPSAAAVAKSMRDIAELWKPPRQKERPAANRADFENNTARNTKNTRTLTSAQVERQRGAA